MNKDINGQAPEAKIINGDDWLSCKVLIDDIEKSGFFSSRFKDTFSRILREKLGYIIARKLIHTSSKISLDKSETKSDIYDC